MQLYIINPDHIDELDKAHCLESADVEQAIKTRFQPVAKTKVLIEIDSRK